jgi:hypothetical protein
VAADDWDNAMRLALSVAPPSLATPPGKSIDEYRRELEAILEIARVRRRELGTALARVRAANGFTRQGFGASPGF